MFSYKILNKVQLELKLKNFLPLFYVQDIKISVYVENLHNFNFCCEGVVSTLMPAMPDFQIQQGKDPYYGLPCVMTWKLSNYQHIQQGTAQYVS